MEAKINSRQVFINCPFDEEYRTNFRALIFCIIDCGFIPRCALELNNSTQIRLEKIIKIISESQFGIHDLSRATCETETGLARFNMPLELGLFIGSQKFGNKVQKNKEYLVLDTEKFRYQKFISDIAGQDIRAHQNDPNKIIEAVRNWLRNNFTGGMVPGHLKIIDRFQQFSKDLSGICTRMHLDFNNIQYVEFVSIVESWIEIEDAPSSVHSSTGSIK
jgi:hypothetical protein